MSLESKLKYVALNAAVDITLKGTKKSPERCARNLIELGTTAFPEIADNTDKDILYKKLLEVCVKAETIEAKKLFFSVFS